MGFRQKKVDVLVENHGVECADQFFEYKFDDIGGLWNNAGAGKTGDVLFTTVGAASGDRYTIILYVTKKYT